MTLQPVYQTIMQGNVQQGTAAVQAMAPQENDPDFKYKAELYASAKVKLGRVLKAREADPGHGCNKTLRLCRLHSSST